MTDLDRRTLLALTAASTLGCQASRAAPTPPTVKPGTGKPGEFDFLAGEWRIKHRRMTAPNVWDEFDGEATCWTILGGVGSVEELRIPARDFAGLGIRLLDHERRMWTDFWVNAKSGVLASPGTDGAFVDGAGIFSTHETDDGKPIVVRGVWDQITPESCRWRQSVSRDDGATWEDNWIMTWTRVTGTPARSP
jgi:hypothetical protein